MSAASLASLLRTQAEAHPEAPLLIDADTGDARTYAATYQQALRWAAFYRDQGLEQGHRVAVILPNGLDFAELYLGAALAGITLCPYNPALMDGELLALITRFGAALVLTTSARVMSLAASLPISVWSVGPRGHLPAGLPAPADSLPPVSPDQLMVLIMTSGTTGGVKACRLTQANLHWTSARTVEAFGLDAHSRYLTPLPLFHINAQVVGLLAAIQAGGSVALGPRLPAAKIWDVAARCGATGLSTVPALLLDLLELPGSPPPSLEYVVCSSAPISAATRERFEDRCHLPLLVCYGLSEAGCFVSYGRPSPVSPAHSVGMPLGCEVRVMGEEILVRGPGIFASYDGDAAASALALRDGWLHTGDCGSIDDQGFLTLRGRLKDMINRGGEKIAPDAIEAVLRECPGVVEVAVFGVPDDRLGEEVGAALVLAPDADLTDEDLWDYCQERLAEFEIPKSWRRVDALPRGATGKVLRRVLQESCAHEG